MHSDLYGMYLLMLDWEECSLPDTPTWLRSKADIKVLIHDGDKDGTSRDVESRAIRGEMGHVMSTETSVDAF